MSDQLVEIPRDQLIKLRDMYSINWPNNLVGFYTIDNFIKWLNKEPNTKNLKILSLNNDWPNDGLVLIIDRYQLFINTLDTNLSRLKTALQLLDWSRGYKISSFYERYHSAVIEVIRDKKLSIEYDSLTILYYLPKSEAEKLEIDCPRDITLKKLSENDAIIIDELWPNRHEGSLYFMKRLIRLNENIGAYTMNGELVAWSVRLQAGPLGAVQVKESHKRRKLGSLVSKTVAKILAKTDQDTYALVNDTNWPSRFMFEKLGFKPIDNVYWLRTHPTLPSFHWKDDDDDK